MQQSSKMNDIALVTMMLQVLSVTCVKSLVNKTSGRVMDHYAMQEFDATLKTTSF